MDELIKQDVNSMAAIKEVNDSYNSSESNSMFLMDGNSCGLCINCDLMDNCTLKGENKIFCEHYL
jgi:hypothetical protein